MPHLARSMDHAAAAAHLREEVAQTARRETGRLVTPADTAFFGAVRGVMSDIDYVAALYFGWNGNRRDQISTKRKTIRYLRDVLKAATGDKGYERWAEHLYGLYRTGLVHLRAPKSLENRANRPPRLAWMLLYPRRTQLPQSAGGEAVHLDVVPTQDPDTALLALSVKALFDDYLTSVEYFATQLEREARAPDNELLTRWRQTADALVEPEPTTLRW